MRQRTCVGPCTGGATAEVRSMRYTAAAAPTSRGVRCVCSGGPDDRSGGRGGRRGGGRRSGAEFTGCGEPRRGARDGPVAGGHHQPDRGVARADARAHLCGDRRPGPRRCSGRGGVRGVGDRSADRIRLCAGRSRGQLHRSGHRGGGEDRCAPQLARRVGRRPYSARGTRAAVSARAVGGCVGRTGSR